MAAWTEPCLPKEQFPKPQQYMKSSSRTWIERYCEPNDGYIEVINDSDKEDQDQPKDEKIGEGVILGFTGRTKNVEVKKLSPKLRNLDTPEVFNKKSPILRLLPDAPKESIMPATLSRRKKNRHHAAGWHDRTMMESKAAEKLLSRIDPAIHDVMPVVIKVIAEARQITLRLIAEENSLTIEQSLKAVVEKLHGSPDSYEIVGNYLTILPRDVSPVRANDLEKVQAGMEDVPREIFEFFGALLGKKIAALDKRKRGDNEEKIGAGDEKELDVEVEIL